MDEYIKREALMRRIKEIHCAECDSYHGVRCRACWVDDTLGYIDSEPTIDAVPVVRCKDCVNGTFCLNSQGADYVDCMLDDYSVRKPDDFCSYGEQKEGDD